MGNFIEEQGAEFYAADLSREKIILFLPQMSLWG